MVKLSDPVVYSAMMLAPAPSSLQSVPVWDSAVRAFHWSLVLAIALAAITGYLLGVPWLALHIAGGVAALVLVLFRLIWGFAGSTHSRFASFLPRPAEVIDHLKGLAHRHHEPHAGHNPLGALMVFALLAMVLVLGVSGLGVLGGMLKQGPLKAVLTFDMARNLRGFHETGAALLLFMVAGHVAGVVYESLRARDNLARAMVTGSKALSETALAAPHNQIAPRPSRPFTALALSLGAAALLVPLVIKGLNAPPHGVPPATLDPAYAKACGDCHMAYPPSLLPAGRWADIMAGLSDHFGEDASLAPADAQTISAYLAANSAEHWDTLAAHVLATNTSKEPLRITTTGFWQRMHGDIPAAVFARKSIATKANCAACHGDAATGLFAPQNIHVPKE